MSEDWDDEGSPGQKDELAREWNFRREQHYNAGYREGLDQGKERTIQQGFDTGFKQGCAAGYEWGLLQGATSTLRVFAGQLQGVPVQQATALADKLGLPKKHVMLSQCEALMHQDTAQDASKSERQVNPQDSSHITSEVFAQKLTAEELQALMSHAHSSLHSLGYSVDPRQDMQQQLHQQQQQQQQAQQQQ